MTQKTRVRLGMALLALVLVPALAFAQATQVGQIGGEVKDATGGVLPGATVTLTSVERATVRTLVTDAQGKFLFTAVPIGRYNLVVKLQSFQNTTLADTLVEAERTTSLAVTMKVAGVEVATTVSGATPIVDTKNQTLETHVRAEEFSKLAIGRSYHSLIGVAPGVVGTANPNVHGALSSNNIFMFDGVNTTDVTTGTFGMNLNFEAIQEVVIRTSSVGVEYGRGTGAIVDVITRSGTNRFEGSFKYLGSNDNWNEQNTAKNEVTGASLARVKFDKVNSTYTGTIGGPILTNRAWFFFNYENYQQTTKAQWPIFRITGQVAPNHSVFVKYSKNNQTGFIRDYWGSSAELLALTQQDQGGDNVAVQYNGVLGSKWTASLLAARATSFIDVIPFATGGAIESGAPILDLVDNRFYNGATFDGGVNRPRNQVYGALEYFTTLAGKAHALKMGVDWQGLESINSFRFPANRVFYVTGYNPVTKSYCPGLTSGAGCATRVAYEEYDADPSTSKGNQTAIYVRDKVQVGPRVSLEAGLRIEKQSGKSDVGAGTVDTTDYSPRISGSYAVTKDNKTILVGSYGRFFDGILQDFSDQFANVPQQGNYDTFVWTGSAYVFDSRVEQGASAFKPNLDVKPRRLDETTFGMERQLSNQIGIGARFIWRTWANFIDDVRVMNTDGSITRTVTNLDEAERTYKGVELTVD